MNIIPLQKLCRKAYVFVCGNTFYQLVRMLVSAYLYTVIGSNLFFTLNPIVSSFAFIKA